MTIKGSLLSRVPIVSDFQSKIFKSVFSPKIDVWSPKQAFNTSGVTDHLTCFSLSDV